MIEDQTGKLSHKRCTIKNPQRRDHGVNSGEQMDRCVVGKESRTGRNPGASENKERGIDKGLVRWAGCCPGRSSTEGPRGQGHVDQVGL